MAFPRKNRLKKSKDFKEVIGAGHSTFTNVLALRWRKNSEEKQRFSVIVPVRVAGHATQRNTLRRRILAVLEQYWTQLCGTCDIIITVRRLPAEEQNLRTEVISILKKSDILNR